VLHLLSVLLCLDLSFRPCFLLERSFCEFRLQFPVALCLGPPQISALCKELAPLSQRYVDAFGIPKHLVAAPIAFDWEEFNKVDNVGEVDGRRF
jgi:hypothetical protein